MGSWILLMNILACVAGVALFSAFILSFRLNRFCLATAAVLYGIGVIACLSPYAYFHFFQGSDWTFGRYPTLEWLVPILFLIFGIVASVSLWLPFPQKAALWFGMVLFGIFSPLLVLMRALPEFLQFHHALRPVELTWFVYAILWFRIRERWAKFERSRA